MSIYTGRTISAKTWRVLVTILGLIDLIILFTYASLYFSELLGLTMTNVIYNFIFGIRILHISSIIGMFLFMLSDNAVIMYSWLYILFIEFVFLELVMAIILLIYLIFVPIPYIYWISFAGFISYDILAAFILFLAPLIDRESTHETNNAIGIRKAIDIFWKLDTVYALIYLILFILFVTAIPYIGEPLYVPDSYIIALQIFILLSNPILIISIVGNPSKSNIGGASDKSAVLIISIFQAILTFGRLFVLFTSSTYLYYSITASAFLLTGPTVITFINLFMSVIYVINGLIILIAFGYYYLRATKDIVPQEHFD